MDGRMGGGYMYWLMAYMVTKQDMESKRSKRDFSICYLFLGVSMSKSVPLLKSCLVPHTLI